MNNLDKAQRLKEKYVKDCVDLITNEVERIMRIHKNLVEFSDCMGLHMFTDKKGESVYLVERKGTNSRYEAVYGDTYKTFSILNDMYNELLNGESLGITVKKDHLTCNS